MIQAKKSLGQNFLSNPDILGKIVGAADLTKADTVLEVGPGTGNLTHIIAEKAGNVIAIEKDHRLIEELGKRFPDTERIKIIEGDALEINPKSLGLKAGEYKIVANIPYYITSHFIRTIFEKWPHPSVIVLTIQKEVAHRIVAQPPHMSLLALSVQFYANAKIIDTIKRGSFNPMPKVDSAIIQITPRSERKTSNEEKDFFRLAKIGFASKRKTLLNNLLDSYGTREQLTEVFKKLYIDDKIRAERIPFSTWEILNKELSQYYQEPPKVSS